MKRKLKLFWKEWGISLEEAKMLGAGVMLFIELYAIYFVMWLFS